MAGADRIELPSRILEIRSITISPCPPWLKYNKKPPLISKEAVYIPFPRMVGGSISSRPWKLHCWGRRCLHRSEVFVPFEGARGINPLFSNTAAAEDRFVLFLATVLPSASFPLRTRAGHLWLSQFHYSKKEAPAVKGRGVA